LIVAREKKGHCDSIQKNKAKRLELPYYRKEKTAEESLRKKTEKKT
jgi:hypothetical protein